MDDLGHYVRSVSTPLLVSVGAVAVATTYYLATRAKPLPRVCDVNMQSVEVPVRLPHLEKDWLPHDITKGWPANMTF